MMFKVDGSIEMVNIDNKTLMGAAYMYDNSTVVSTIDTFDVSKKTLENGDLEYITCLYDADGVSTPDNLNKHCPLYTCHGDFMVIKTLKSSSRYFLDDTLLDIGTDCGSVLDLVVECAEEARRMAKEANTHDKYIFPCVKMNGLGRGKFNQMDVLTLNLTKKFELKKRSLKYRAYRIGDSDQYANLVGYGDDKEAVERIERDFREKKEARERIQREKKEAEKKHLKKREQKLQRKIESNENAREASKGIKYVDSKLKPATLPSNYVSNSDNSDSDSSGKAPKTKRRNAVAVQEVANKPVSKNRAKKEAKLALKSKK